MENIVLFQQLVWLISNSHQTHRAHTHSVFHFIYIIINDPLYGFFDLFVSKVNKKKRKKEKAPGANNVNVYSMYGCVMYSSNKSF